MRYPFVKREYFVEVFFIEDNQPYFSDLDQEVARLKELRCYEIRKREVLRIILRILIFTVIILMLHFICKYALLWSKMPRILQFSRDKLNLDQITGGMWIKKRKTRTL